MRIALFAIFALMLVSVSRAELDDYPDQLGIYFDLNADVVCATADSDSLVTLYFVITNPSMETIWGVEFDYRMVVSDGNEENVVLYDTRFPPGVFDCDPYAPSEGFSYCFPVLPMNGAPFVVLEMQYFFTAPVAVEFYLGPYPHDMLEYPAYASAPEGPTLLGVVSGDYSLAVASVNGDCTILATEIVTFGDVKCLFRSGVGIQSLIVWTHNKHLHPTIAPVTLWARRTNRASLTCGWSQR